MDEDKSFHNLSRQSKNMNDDTLNLTTKKNLENDENVKESSLIEKTGLKRRTDLMNRTDLMKRTDLMRKIIEENNQSFQKNNVEKFSEDTQQSIHVENDKNILELNNDNGNDNNENYDQIFQLILNHKYEEFKVFIDKGLDKNLKNSKNETLLDVALKAFDNISLETRANIDNIFYCLMENGYTNFNMKNVEVTVLREIIHDNKTSILNYLIDHGLPIEKRNSEGNTLLFLAIFYRKLDIIKLLLDKGANINHKNKKGESVHDYNRVKNFERSLEDYNEIESILNKYKSNENDEDVKKDQIFQSIQDHNYEEFKVLIGKGFNKKLKNSNNETLLDMSLKSYSSINLETRDNTNNIFYYLMENGYKDLDIKNITMKVIREIIHDNKLSIFIFLIEQGLNLEMRNSEGNTPLFLAIFYRKLEFIKLLLVKGANIKHINKKGESVYDYNKIKNFDRAFDDYNLIESILKKYDTNTYNKFRIFQLIKNHDYKDFKNLIETNFFRNLKNSNNETLLDVALKSYDTISINTRSNTDSIFYYLIENGYTEYNMKNVTMKVIREIIHDNKIVILKTLMKHGLLLEMKNSEGNTPLFLAIFYRNTKIIEMLLENGANIKHKNKNGEGVHEYNKIKNYKRAFEDYTKIESIFNKFENNNKYDIFKLIKNYEVNKVKIIIDQGIDKNIRNSENETMLDVALDTFNSFDLNDFHYFIYYLIENDVTTFNMEKVTIKMVNQIIEDKKLNILKFLIDHKLNLEMENKDGWTPLFYAVSFPRPVMVEALLKYGANINHKNIKNQNIFEFNKIKNYQSNPSIYRKIESILNKYK